MPIASLGIDHTRAPLALRERLTVSTEQRDALLAVLHADATIAEAVVLSTCNRNEIYVVAGDPPSALDHAANSLMQLTGVVPSEVDGLLERRMEDDAVRHLFAVAASLRSLVVGETQIITQVREAFEHASAREVGGPELAALGRAAVACGKRVRAETSLGTTDTSVGDVAVEMAVRRFGGLQGRTVLLLGAGRINEVVAQRLHECGVGRFAIVSRTLKAAETLATRFDGHAETLERLPELLAAADLAITAARATEPLIVQDTIAPRAPERPLAVYDLAVPRNVDPMVGRLAGVELVDMDGLDVAGPVGQASAIAEAWSVVDASVERYLIDSRIRRAVPLIAALRAHVDRQKEAELARALAGLGHLDEDDREAVEMLAHRLVNRMFHHLAARLKAAAASPDAESHLKALAFLFDAPGAQEHTAAAPSAHEPVES